MRRVSNPWISNYIFFLGPTPSPNSTIHNIVSPIPQNVIFYTKYTNI